MIFEGLFAKVLSFTTSGAIEKVMNAITARANIAAVVHGQDVGAATQVIVGQMKAELETRKLQAASQVDHSGLVKFFAIPLGLHLWAMVLDAIFHLNWKVAQLPAPFDQGEYIIITSFFVTSIGASTVNKVVQTVWK